jgi:periplasmic protein TonB
MAILPGQSESAGHCEPESGAENLPPHRAAVASPPVSPDAFTGVHRSALSWAGVLAAVLLHIGFLAAAMLWGQGSELPPPTETVISVEIVRSAPPAPPDMPATPAETVTASTPAPATPAETVTASTPAADGPASATATEVTEIEPLPGDFPQEAEPQPRSPALATLKRLKLMLAARTSRLAEPEIPQISQAPPLTVASSTSDDEPDYLPKDDLPKDDPRRSSATPEADRPEPAPARHGYAHRRSSGSAGASRIAMALYNRRVRARIASRLPLGTFGPGRVAVGIRLSRQGGVMGARVLRSSGNPAVDRAAVVAVRAAGPYPAPPARALPRQLNLSVSFYFE